MHFLERFIKGELSPAPEESLQADQSFDGRYSSEVKRYFSRLFPRREGFTYREVISDDQLHIDINVLKPNARGNYYVLFTTGMSDLPMTLPSEMEEKERKALERAELFLFLPGDWPLEETVKDSEEDPFSAEKYWPVRMLRFFAHYPHRTHTWLRRGDVIPNNPGYDPVAPGVGFGAAVLTRPQSTPVLKAKDGQSINLYMTVPVYKEEAQYRLKYGMEKLVERLLEGHLHIILDEGRPNFCEDFTEG